MSAHCCNHDADQTALRSQRYRRIWWLALLVAALMVVVDSGAGLRAGSVALLADALDFLGDSANYAISLWVLGGTLLALTAISTVPMLAKGFGFGALTAGQWALAMATGLCMVVPLQWLKRVAPHQASTP